MGIDRMHALQEKIRGWIPEHWRRWAAGLSMGFLFGCVGPPDGVRPIKGFNVDRYLGVWYEIARLDHPFERGLSDVSAIYTPREDGGIDVLNRGYDAAKQKWKEARGRAYFTGGERRGSLKVSFFGPFYGGYHIIALDQDHYGYALVCGSNRSYLWILARRPSLDRDVTDRLVNEAKTLGFDTDQLIYVSHQQRDG